MDFPNTVIVEEPLMLVETGQQAADVEQPQTPVDPAQALRQLMREILLAYARFVPATAQFRADHRTYKENLDEGCLPWESQTAQRLGEMMARLTLTYASMRRLKDEHKAAVAAADEMRAKLEALGKAMLKLERLAPHAALVWQAVELDRQIGNEVSEVTKAAAAVLSCSYLQSEPLNPAILPIDLPQRMQNLADAAAEVLTAHNLAAELARNFSTMEHDQFQLSFSKSSILEPNCPTLEKVIQFVQQRTAQMVKEFEAERKNLRLKTAYASAIQRRKVGLRQLGDLLALVPVKTSPELPEPGHGAVYTLAQRVLERVQSRAHHLNPDARPEYLHDRAAAAQPGGHPLDELELIGQIREQTESLAYAIGAFQLAAAAARMAEYSDQPAVPMPDRALIDEYNRLWAERIGKISQAKRRQDARELQVQAWAHRLGGIVNKLQKRQDFGQFSDALLIPLTVAQELVQRHKRGTAWC